MGEQDSRSYLFNLREEKEDRSAHVKLRKRGIATSIASSSFFTHSIQRMEE